MPPATLACAGDCDTGSILAGELLNPSTQGEIQINAICELTIGDQLDEICFALNLSLLQLQNREKVHASGLVPQVGHTNRLHVICQSVFRKGEPLGQKLFIG